MKKSTLIIVLVVAILAIAAFGWLLRRGSRTTSDANTNISSSLTNTFVNTPSTNNGQLTKLADGPVATIETNLGSITVRFYTSDAPELTRNFLELAKSGYYANTTFHRIVPGFVIQGGDPTGTGAGGHSYKGDGEGLADEPGALALKHLRGAVAWAKSSLPNSIGSQFYIALKPLTQLDGSYSVFGQVIEGMDVVDAIAAVPTDAQSRPTTPVTIIGVTVRDNP